MIDRRFPRTRQPQGVARRDSAFFAGLPGEFAWTPYTPGIATLGSGSTQTQTLNATGRVLEFAGGGVGAANYLSIGVVPAQTIERITFVLVVTRTATPSAYSQLALASSDGSSGQPQIILEDPANTNLLTVRTSIGGVVSTGLLYDAFGADPQCLIFSMIGGSKVTAVQRNLRTGAVNTFEGALGGGAWVTLSANDLIVGGRAYGQYALQANSRKYFTLSEQLALSQNPWQLYRPLQRRIWVPVAGGGATNYSLTADVGSYSLTGVDAGVRFSPRVTAEVGSYALTGIDAGLTYSRRLLADVGSYSLTGVDATLTYVPASGAYTLTADTGAYSLTGNDAGLTFARSMTADVGSYTLTGVDAGLQLGRRLTADTGAYSLAGVDADLIYTALGPTAYALTAETGSYVLTGSPAGLTYGDGSAVIDTHDGFWAKEWARIRSREKRKYQEEIQERVEEIQDEIAEVEQQIVEVRQTPKPKKATPARDFYAEQARIVEHLIARRNQLIDEEDEELLLLL